MSPTTGPDRRDEDGRDGDGRPDADGRRDADERRARDRDQDRQPRNPDPDPDRRDRPDPSARRTGTRRPGTGAAMTLRLIRREIRGDLPLLACLAVLTLVLTALCAWAPVSAGRQEDRALRQRIDAAQSQAPLITLTTVPEVFSDGPPALDMATLLSDGRTLSRRLGGSAARHLTFAGSGSYDYNPADVLTPLPPDASGPRDTAVTSTKLTASHLPGVQSHLRYLSGHAPADRTPPGTPPQIGLSQETAQALGVRAGSRLTLEFTKPPSAPRPPHADLVVSGVFRPVAGADDFWSARPTLVQPLRYPQQHTSGTVLSARGLVGTDAADVLAGAGVSGPLVTWQLRPELPHAALDEARALTGPLSEYGTDLSLQVCNAYDEFTGDRGCRVGSQLTGPLVVTDSLTPLLTAFTAQDHQARALAAFAVDSLAAVVLATTAVAVRLLLRRRRAHLRLQRARGASTARLVALRSAVAWPVVLAAAVLGWVAGRHLAPTGTSGSAQPLAAAVATAVVALTVSLLTWRAVREPGRPKPRRTRRRRAVAGGRRVVLELTVLLAAAAGVVALRSQGPDWVLGAVPVVVALAAVLILLRLYPLVLRLLVLRTRRGRGAVGFIGTARAAHDARATGLALFVLVLTLGTAVFGGLVQRTIGDGLVAGAAWSTGADADAVTTGITAPAPGALTGTPGVRTALQQVHTLELVGQSDGTVVSPVAVITVDPRQLAALAPHSPLARTLVSALGAPAAAANAPLPSVVSPGLRAREPAGDLASTAQVEGQSSAHLTLHPVGTLTAAQLRDPLLGPATGQVPAGTPLLITTAAAERLIPHQTSGSTVLLLQGGGSGAAQTAALRAAATKALGPLARISTRSETLSTLREDGLRKGLGTIYTAGSALAALAGLLAVVLELVLTSHERGRTISFLRTLGLDGRDAGAVLFLQLLPLAVASALGGTLLGLLEPRLMAKALNLRQFTGGPAEPALRTDYSLTLVLVAGVVVLVLAAAAAETALARRRRLGAVLRLT